MPSVCDAVGLGDARRLGDGPLAVEVEQGDVHAERGAALAEGEPEARRPAGHDGDGHQLSSGITKSACSRVSFDDLIRHPSAPFS